MKISDITSLLASFAPLEYAEDFDNVGLIVGDDGKAANGVLITLDTTEEVVDEAITKGCNLIVSFHPIIFDGLKRLNGKTHVERAVIKAVKHDICIYAMHTALDNAFYGVNHALCNALELENQRILIPQKGTLKKLTAYIPISVAEPIKYALFEAGAERVSYTKCSLFSNGVDASKKEEAQIQVVFLKHLESTIISSLLNFIPKKEADYEVVALENRSPYLGLGMLGDLRAPMPYLDFLKVVKHRMGTPTIRYSSYAPKTISTVAVLGGSGSFAIDAAKARKADAFLTSDLKYHDFYRHDNKLLIVDIGHYESERFVKTILLNYLTEKLPKFAVSLSEVESSSIKYI